jgi:hypothetical protein
MLEPIDYWRFHEEFTVIEVVLLSLDINPSDKPCVLSDTQKPDNFDAIFSGIKKAISNDKLKARIYHNNGYNNDNEPDWYETSIEICDLKSWMTRINFKPPFFFPEVAREPDYLNKDHPRYSAQLAAAVKVWIAFEDNNLVGAKTPKTAMEDWLESRYSELGLVHQGNISKNAITECAKVANWNDKGGATTTPTG